MTDVGEFVNASLVVLTDGVRGVQYRFEASMYADGAAPGTCGGEPVVGAEFDARDYPFLRAGGKVVGTGQNVPVEGAWVTLGDGVVPARYYFIVARENMELAFSPELGGIGGEGADGSIEITLDAGGPSRIEIVPFRGELIIANSAFGTTS